MQDIARVVGPEGAVELFGIRLVGLTAENGKKLLVTLVFIAAVYLLRRLLLLGAAQMRDRNERLAFWLRQSISIFAALLMVVGVVSVWFDDPTRLTTALGLVTAGLAFALQRVVTAFAGYVVILRGRTFNVGDRITMGGVRGDVIGLDFTQTTIMEMGQPPDVQDADPAMWVRSRQYTGRVVTVSNARIFEEPVFNYTRDFPFIWEEMHLPIAYRDDRQRAESILLRAAEKHAVPLAEMTEAALQEMHRRYFMRSTDIAPRVFYRLTDNWLELTVRFVTREHGVRDVKDAMSREILRDLDAAKIGIASATFEIVGVPPLELTRSSSATPTA